LWAGSHPLGSLHGSLRRRPLHNPDLKAFRDRLVDNGKPKLVAIIAVARKLITILNALIRDDQPWREQNP
jgi:hypothetical protein